MAAKISGVGVAAIGAGSVFLYAGIKGKSVLAVIQGVVQGKSPASAPQANPISDTTAALAGSGGGSAPSVLAASPSGIAQDALRYQGAGYVWGGAPAKGTGNWDCSSFANWVIGHDFGQAIPGYAAGTYTGSSHGPPTLSWLTWSGCTTVGKDPAAAQPGDLCVWQTHMGICTGSGSMISALNPKLGTRVTSISGGAPPGELLYVRRLG